jgi:hypothetical protein
LRPYLEFIICPIYFFFWKTMLKTMHLGASRVFGIVAILVSLCSFYLALQGDAEQALFVTLMTWGSIFLIVGILLIMIGRIF